MSRQAPWPRILAESLAIVASILLAFSIQAWWEGSQDRGRAEVYLESLREEVLVNLQGLDVGTRGLEGSMEAIRAARRLLASGWREVPSDSVLSLIVRGGGIATLAPVTNTYDQLVATGDLRLIPITVRDALSDWQRELQTATGYWDRYSLDYRTTTLDPYLLSETGWAEIMSTFGPAYGDVPIRFRTDIERLAEDRKLDNLLAHKLFLDQGRLLAYQLLREALEDLDVVLGLPARR